MGCAMGTIKILLFVFNFIFVVCGLGILTAGIIVHLKLSYVTSDVGVDITLPSITLIVVGSIVFVIAFFGCCGAIRSSHCMIVTFASMLMFILLLQVAIAVYAFVVVKPVEDGVIERNYDKIFQEYPMRGENKEIIDVVQSSFKCCGVISKADYNKHGNFTGDIPWSCCNKVEGEICKLDEAYDEGCAGQLKGAIQLAGTLLGGIAIGIAAIELIGIIFALCLANSIRNAERRGYRV